MSSDTFLESPRGDAAFAKLMLSPPSAPRKATRKRKAPAEVAAPAPIGTLYDLWKASPRGKRPHKSPLAEAVPTYKKWLQSRVPAGLAQREADRAAAEWAQRRAPALLAADWRRFKHLLAWQDRCACCGLTNCEEL